MPNALTFQTYQDLDDKVGETDVARWYAQTYPLFTNFELQTKDDFLRLVGIAYSWMPTVPSLKEDLKWDEAKDYLSGVSRGDKQALEEFLQVVVPAVNNSIVGVSKALHFAYPEHVHIIDSNVVTGWRALFYPSGVRGKSDAGIAPLPSAFGSYGEDEKKLWHHIQLYTRYCQNIIQWLEAIREATGQQEITVRDIELKLYLLGKQMKDS